MRGLCAVGSLAALLLSIGTTFAADPQPAEDTPASPWYKRLFAGSSKPAVPEKKSEPEAEKPPTRDEVAKSLDYEQKLYLKRLEFCTRLRQIAVESKDDSLLVKADALEKQATDVYLSKTSKLPTILQDVKAAEAALDAKKSETSPRGSASNSRPSRPTNGRPTNRE